MRKILSILGALLLSTSLWALSYNVTFKVGSGDGTKMTAGTTACSDIVSAGADFLDGKVATATNAYSAGSTGVKLGTSTASGVLKMNLTTAGQVKAKSIVVNCKLYNSGKSATLAVNGKAAQSVTAAGSDLTFDIDADITYVELTASKYIWVSSIKVNYEGQTLYLVPDIWSVDNPKYAIWYMNADKSVCNWSEFMELAEGESSIYTAEIPKNQKYVIFVRINNTAAAPNWDDKFNQTGDLEIPTDGKNRYTITGWDNGDNGNSGGTWDKYTAPTFTDVYFVNIDNWAKVNVYGWLKSDGSQNNGWPGVEMTKTGDKLYGSDIYKGRINDTYNMVIISNNGSDVDRTGDQPFDKTKPYFFSGNWYASPSAIPANCAYINAAANNTELTMNKGAVVVYAEGKYAFVKDASGSALIYDNSSNHGLKTGDTITADIPGKVSIYNGLPEFLATTNPITSVKAGETPEIPWATEEPKATNLNQVVVYDTVTFASSAYDNKSITGTWKTKSIKFYDQWGKVIVFDADKKYKVTAANAVYSKSGTTTYQAYIISAEALCLGGPFGLQVNNVSDTLEYIADAGLEAQGYTQYGINNKVLAAGDKIVIENLSCNATWLPTIEDGGAKANFNIVNDTLVAKAAGTFNFYLKQKPFEDKLYIAFTPVEKWYIVGDFTGWFENKAELEATAQADSLAKVIEVESDTLAHFLLVRITETGPAKDTAYYGTHIFEGNLEVMQYGKSSGFWFYADAEKNDVPFQPTNAGDDYTFCVNLKHQDGDKHAPLVSIIIPEETPIEKTFKVKVPAGTEDVYMAADWDPAVTGWEFVKMTADGENQFKHTATVLKSFKYKYCSAADFEHVEVAANRLAIEDRTYGDTTDVVALFKDPKWTDIYLWRKSNDWKAEEFEATGNPDSIVVKVNYAAALPLDSFLIKDGDTYYKIALDAIDMTRANSTDWGLSDALDTKNVTIVIDQAGEYTFVWNPALAKVSVIYPAEAKQDITFKVKTPGAVECYIAGDWDLDGNWTFKKMNAVNAIDHQFELKVENIVASVPYKYSSADDWAHVEVGADRSFVENRTFGDSIDVVARFTDPDWTNIYLWHKDIGWGAEEFAATGNPDSIVVVVNYTAAVLDSFLIVDASGDPVNYYKIDPSADDMTRASSTDWVLEVDNDNSKKNVSIVIDQAGDYTFIWKKSSHKVSVIYPAEVVTPITYRVKVPAGTEEVYMAADWNPAQTGWEFEKMTKNGDVFEFEVADGKKSFEYKYCSAEDFEHVELNADRSYLAVNRTYGDTTDVVALFKDPDWTNVFLKGAFTDWNEVEFQKTDVATVLSLSSSINAAIVDFVIVDRSGDYEVLYKIAEGASNYDRTASESVDEADRWWGLTPDGPDTKNVWLDADINGLYNFQWATDTHNIKIVFPTATGCENVYGTEVELRKVIENGVLYIYRDGKVYNIQGQLVR